MEQMVGSNVQWANQTVLHPVGLLATLAMGLALLLVPRKYAVWPMIFIACFISPAQRVVISSLDFSMMRIMVMFGWTRLFCRNEYQGVRWNLLDTLLVAWAASDTLLRTITFGDFGTFVNRLGTSYDSLGMYFMFRCFVRTWEDISRTVLGFVLASVPTAAVFMVEHFTGRNLFAYLGGVPYDTIVREGRLRCQGAFAHPILAGCFWASMMPLMAAVWFRGARWHLAAYVGLACSCLIIVLCASSTPVVAVGFGLIGTYCFLIRNQMRLVRWVLLLTLTALHLSMQAPVWHLVSRIDLSGGSTGWQRYYLLDQTIRRVGEWWLTGVRTTAPWGAGLVDITNQFVFQAISGGMLTLVLYVALITIGFRHVGRLWRRVQPVRWQLAMAWALGVSLFIHVSNFMAVSYFGQIEMVWYLLLAMIAGMSETAPAPRPQPRPIAPARPPRRRREPRINPTPMVGPAGN